MFRKQKNSVLAGMLQPVLDLIMYPTDYAATIIIFAVAFGIAAWTLCR